MKATTALVPAKRISPQDLAVAATQLRRAESVWQQAVRFDPHERQHTCIYAGSRMEAWLLTWMPGQGTGWHDHGGSAGAFVVIRGTLLEYSATGDHERVTLRETMHEREDVHTFGPNHVHSMRNTGGSPAVSLHVYSPRLETMTRFTLERRRLHVEGVERAGADW